MDVHRTMTNVFHVDMRGLHNSRINSFHDEWYPCPICRVP